MVLAALQEGKPSFLSGKIVKKGQEINDKKGNNEEYEGMDKDMRELEEYCASEIKSQREWFANQAIEALRYGSPREKFDSITVVEALGLRPENLERMQFKQAKQKVAEKLKSW